MKKNIILILAFSFILNNCSNSNSEYLGLVKTQKGLVLRNRPSSVAEKILVIPFLSKIQVLDIKGPSEKIADKEGNWYKVKVDNQTGWVFGPFVDLINTKSDRSKPDFNNMHLTYSSFTYCHPCSPGSDDNQLIFKNGEVQYNAIDDFGEYSIEIIQKGVYSINGDTITINLNEGTSKINEELPFHKFDTKVKPKIFQITWNDKIKGFFTSEKYGYSANPEHLENSNYLLLLDDCQIVSRGGLTAMKSGSEVDIKTKGDLTFHGYYCQNKRK